MFVTLFLLRPLQQLREYSIALVATLPTELEERLDQDLEVVTRDTLDRLAALRRRA